MTNQSLPWLIALIQHCEQSDILYRLDEPLALHTSFHIGGMCSIMVLPKQLVEIASIVQHCYKNEIALLVLGNGSNMLVSDDGFFGVVLKLGSAFAQITQTDENTIFAQAGATLSSVCHFARQKGLEGLSFCYGIPASVGGSVYMNAGAYGGEMKDVVLQVEYLDTQGDRHLILLDQLCFSYRHSFFTDTSHCITGAYFSLKPGDPTQIKTEMEQIFAKRKHSQPIEYPSAGSTFKRPQGAYTARLIEQCGLKGARVGGAEVSQKHGGFVINKDNATCSDVLALVAHIKQVVKSQTGIALECEVKIIE